MELNWNQITRPATAPRATANFSRGKRSSICRTLRLSTGSPAADRNSSPKLRQPRNGGACSNSALRHSINRLIPDWIVSDSTRQCQQDRRCFSTCRDLWLDSSPSMYIRKSTPEGCPRPPSKSLNRLLSMTLLHHLLDCSVQGRLHRGYPHAKHLGDFTVWPTLRPPLHLTPPLGRP